MRIRHTIRSSLVLTIATAVATAQNDPKQAPDLKQSPETQAQQPSPKLPQHDVLQQLTGSWDVTMRSQAVPGVEGLEKAQESTGTEQAELLNNGLWLRSTIHATWDGKPFHGIWLVGYDPHAKQYTGAWVCSDEQDAGLTTMTGAYDDAKKTWLWSGKTPHGDMRSVVVVSDPDTVVETCFLKGADGKEHKCMELTRKRSARSAAPAAGEAAEATARTAPKLPEPIAAMEADLGSWEAKSRCTGAPGEPAIEGEGTERVSAVAGGKWLWIDFAGRFQGQPYEGHGLVGYDPAEQKVVSLWLDSMSPTWCLTRGAPAAGDAELVLEGTCVDPAGKQMQVRQRSTRTDDGRAMHMEMKGPEGASTMVITYRRKDG
jgi:hypothetical protein